MNQEAFNNNRLMMAAVIAAGMHASQHLITEERLRKVAAVSLKQADLIIENSAGDTEQGYRHPTGAYGADDD